MAQPHELTLGQAAAAIRSGDLSPVTLIESLLARIDAVDPKVKAWAYVARDQALLAAREAEPNARTASANRPLHGVPFAAKDIFDSAGMPTEAGSDHYKGRVPPKDSTPIAKLKQAGAILLGKVETTEFADGHPAPSRNPYHVEHSPGGSSAGSGAAVGARMVPMALGSQTVGSVLRPAGFCGVVGFKPTFGRVSRLGVIPMSYALDHVGWLARTVEDIALTLQVLAGYDPDDPDSANVPVDDYVGAAKDGARPPRIGLLQYYFDRADDTMRKSTLAAVERLAKAGAEVDELRLDVDFDRTFKYHRVVQGAEMAHWHIKEGLWARQEKYKSGTQAFIARGAGFPGHEYVEGQIARARTREQFTEALGKVDILVSPTTSAPAPALSENFTGDPAWQSPWTFIGLPVICLPTGLSDKGLPTSIQFGAKAFDEARLLGIASWVESTLGVTMSVPTY